MHDLQFSSLPRGCDSYKCKLLRELLDESVSLPKALKVVKKAKEKIHAVEKLLPPSAQISFRERLIERIEHLHGLSKPNAADAEFQAKAKELLGAFDKQFGVNDFFDLPSLERF